jgi:hypothetical protein
MYHFQILSNKLDLKPETSFYYFNKKATYKITTCLFNKMSMHINPKTLKNKLNPSGHFSVRVSENGAKVTLPPFPNLI